MLNDHKIRQEMFHRLEPYDDIIEQEDYDLRMPAIIPEVISGVRDYFTKPLDTLIYPDKSYAVAIIYATLLERYFGVPLMKSLEDPDLLFGNDQYFVPYEPIITRLIYDEILDEFPPFDEEIPQVAATINYFKREFYLVPNPYFDNTTLS